MANTDEWDKLGTVRFEAVLGGRRVTLEDHLQAADMAMESYRSVMVSRGYDVDVSGRAEYGYRASSETLGFENRLAEWEVEWGLDEAEEAQETAEEETAEAAEAEGQVKPKKKMTRKRPVE